METLIPSNPRLFLFTLIEWLSPAYALRRLEILFHKYPMACNAYCILNYHIRFPHISMPPLLFDEKGRILFPEYNRIHQMKKSTTLRVLTHSQRVKMLRNAESFKTEEQLYKKAQKDFQTHLEFNEEILCNHRRVRYYRIFFADILPADYHQPIPIEAKSHCLRHLSALDSYIGRTRAKSLKEADMLRSAVADWTRIQGIPCLWLYDYYPVGEDGKEHTQTWRIRRLIWDFKANDQSGKDLKQRMRKNKQAADTVAKELSEHLQSCFGNHLHKLYFACVPASSRRNHELRYRVFSELMCRRTGMQNAFDYVFVCHDGEPKHMGGQKQARLSAHPLFIQDKPVLIFDDIITKGNSIADFKALLEHQGAHVIGACSIGKTTRHFQHKKVDV